MTKPIDLPVFTVRAVLPDTLEQMRVIHNQTARSPPGIAAARALGDLSHMVYAPLTANGQPATTSKELLFLDVWVHPKGIMDFFSNEDVVQQGTKLFSSRDATVWMPADGSFSYSLPAPRGKSDRYVGIVRGRSRPPKKSIEIFRSADINADSRTRDAACSPSNFHKLRARTTAHRASSSAWMSGMTSRNERALRRRETHARADGAFYRTSADVDVGAGARSVVRVVDETGPKRRDPRPRTALARKRSYVAPLLRMTRRVSDDAQNRSRRFAFTTNTRFFETADGRRRVESIVGRRALVGIDEKQLTPRRTPIESAGSCSPRGRRELLKQSADEHQR
jgi:hypothetical protein